MMNRFFPIFLILVAIGIVFGYVYPTYTGAITAAQQQISSYDAALSAASAFSQKENDLLAKRNAISATDLTRLQTYLPDGVDNIQLIVDLDALAAKYGVVLSGFSIQHNTAGSSNGAASSTVPTALQSTNVTDSLDLSVSATGTYDAFQSFLTAAEQSVRPLDITQLSLKYSSTGVYTYTITFRIYWLH